MTSPRPPRFPILNHDLRATLRAFSGWSVGLIAALCLYLPLFPSLGGDASMQQLIEQLPAEFTAAIGYQQITTGAGYTQSTFFGLLGYLLISIPAISWGTQAIGTDEERGTLELTLAHGVSRTQLILQRWAALALRLFGLSIVVGVTIVLLNGPSRLELTLTGIVSATLALWAAAFLSGSAALAAGAFTGRRVVALLGGSGIAVLGYVLNAVGNQSDSLHWLRQLSPVHWAFGNEPLRHGFDSGGMALLFGTACVLVICGTLSFRARDIGR